MDREQIKYGPEYKIKVKLMKRIEELELKIKDATDVLDSLIDRTQTRPQIPITNARVLKTLLVARTSLGGDK